LLKTLSHHADRESVFVVYFFPASIAEPAGFAMRLGTFVLSHIGFG
jgi:hypothetical protein